MTRYPILICIQGMKADSHQVKIRRNNRLLIHIICNIFLMSIMCITNGVTNTYSYHQYRKKRSKDDSDRLIGLSTHLCLTNSSNSSKWTDRHQWFKSVKSGRITRFKGIGIKGHTLTSGWSKSTRKCAIYTRFAICEPSKMLIFLFLKLIIAFNHHKPSRPHFNRIFLFMSVNSQSKSIIS